MSDFKENKEFKKMYEKLDEKTRKEVDSLEKEEWKIEVLKILSDNIVLELYKNMKPLTKQKIDSLKIRDRASILKQLLSKKELEKKKRNTTNFYPRGKGTGTGTRTRTRSRTIRYYRRRTRYR